MFGGVSGAAVDGKPSRFFSDGSTTMTSLETEPWWQVSKQACGGGGGIGRVFLLGVSEVSQNEASFLDGVGMGWGYYDGDTAMHTQCAHTIYSILTLFFFRDTNNTGYYRINHHVF